MRAIVAEIPGYCTCASAWYTGAMNAKIMWSVITVLSIIIIGLAWVLFAIPAPVTAPTTGMQNGEEPLHSKVSVLSPQNNATVGKDFVVMGQAPGNWYFEASFPIEVQDANGIVLATVIAQAQSDWMTTDLVPFLADVALTGNYAGAAKLVLKRDNPSGLPENDDHLDVPIVLE